MKTALRPFWSVDPDCDCAESLEGVIPLTMIVQRLKKRTEERSGNWHGTNIIHILFTTSANEQGT